MTDTPKYFISLDRLPSQRNFFVAVDVVSALTDKSYHLELQCKKDSIFVDEVTYRRKNEHAHKSAFHFLLLEMREQGFDEECCVNLVFNTLRAAMLRLKRLGWQSMIIHLLEDNGMKSILRAEIKSN